jgi:small subunit ribosomal protein S16
VVLNSERVNYWIGVGAQPSDRVAVLIKKYGTNGTHLEAQKAAIDRLNQIRRRPVTQSGLPKLAKKLKSSKE